MNLVRKYNELGSLFPISKDKSPAVPFGTDWRKYDITTMENEPYGVAISPLETIVCVDIDMKNGKNGLLTAEMYEFKDTLTQVTPSGGRHFIYRITADQASKLPNAVEILPGVDLRVGGKGYFAVWPTPGYEWLDVDEENLGDLVADLPYSMFDVFLRNATVKPEAQKISQATNGISYPQGSRDSSLFRELCYMRRRGYTLDELIESAKLLNKRCTPPLPESQAIQKAHQAFKYDPEPLLEHFTQAYETLNSPDEKVVPLDERDYSYLIPTHGAIKSIVDAMLAAAVVPQPLLCIGASLSILATVLDGRLSTSGDLMPNLYVAALADSGTGKDHIRKMISRILAEYGKDQMIGAETYASASAIAGELEDNPSILCRIDEFGLKLLKWGSVKASSHEQEILSLLTEIYTTAGSTYYGKAFAKSSIKQGKTEGRKKIVNPNLNIYGTSVHKPFWKSFDNEALADGSLARYLILPGKVSESINKEITISQIDNQKSLILFAANTLKAIDKAYKRKSVTDEFNRVYECWSSTKEASEISNSRIEKIKADYSADRNRWVRPLVNRASALARKIALIHAASRLESNKSIIEEDVNFAWNLVEISMEVMRKAYQKGLGESNDHTDARNELLSYLKDNKDRMVSRTEAQRNCSQFSRLTPAMRASVYQELILTGEVTINASLQTDDPKERSSIASQWLALNAARAKIQYAAA